MKAPEISNERIWSVDILRGFVIALMAMDHVREFWALTIFWPEDVSQTNAAWFFTRWLTHFCAPVFVFLAGTSAFLFGEKVKDKAKLTRFLLTRGLWLVLIEIFVINISWTFSLHTTVGFVFVQVIWIIGVSMIVLAGLIWLKTKWIALFGFVLIAGHNLLDGITPESLGSLGWLWKMLHIGFSYIPLTSNGSFGLLSAYPIIPWPGVIALGYVFGKVMMWEPRKRKSFILKLGIGLTVSFVILRLLNIYGDPSPWSAQDRGALYTFLDFLGTTKYPPSLLFLLMTLGPGLLLLIPFENWKGKGMEILKVYGKVPFFFYIIHFPIINLSAQLYHYFRYGEMANFFMVFMSPQLNWPEGYVPQVWLIYLVWPILMVVLYFLCKWYGQYKASRKYWWLKYL